MLIDVGEFGAGSLPGAKVMAITETWLKPSIPDSAINLDGYNCIRRDRLVRLGGGVCAFIDSQIPYHRISKYETTEIESLWFTLRPFRLPRAVSSILVAVIYHPTDYGASENLALVEHMLTRIYLPTLTVLQLSVEISMVQALAY